MKRLLLAVLMCISVPLASACLPGTETASASQQEQQKAPEGPGKGVLKEVCTDRLDRSGNPVLSTDGKPVQDCRTIRVRKKLEGTPVPSEPKK